MGKKIANSYVQLVNFKNYVGSYYETRYGWYGSEQIFIKIIIFSNLI